MLKTAFVLIENGLLGTISKFKQFAQSNPIINMNSFQDLLIQFNEYGIVEETHHPIVLASGLPNAKAKEVVVFENNQHGQVQSLNEHSVEILTFSNTPIKVGSKVTRTGQPLFVSPSDNLLGRLVNPFLEGFSQNDKYVEQGTKKLLVDSTPLAISHRLQINQPFVTGVALVDLLTPLGKGQRELIVGDRKTGKSAFTLTSIKSQVLSGAIAIYAAVGKKSSQIKVVQDYLQRENIINRSIIIATSARDALGMIYLAPYTAMSLAEYFRDQGNHVLLILDDLSTHAQVYREISLIAKRFPGRDSYPGNVFYTHARLLERAGHFILPNNKSGSITCLPIAETLENDLTDYIVSNLIGITDGHILFDSNDFTKGRRPAINPGISVTRVGKQTQSILHQEISRELMTFITKYEKSLTYSHFGRELTQQAQDVLLTGQRLFSFFNQPIDLVIPLNVQLIFPVLILMRYFNDEPSLTYQFRNKLIAEYQENPQSKQLIDELVNSKNYRELQKNLNEKKNVLLKTCQP